MSDDPGPPWKRAKGHKPRGLDDKRVAVILRNGSVCGEEPVANACPAGWPVDGKGKCRWTHNDPKFPAEFDIIWYRVHG